jgi:hypothetical protein
MTTADERLAALLSDAVADVEPADRLDAIRERTRVTALGSRRRRFYVVGGTMLATAAAVTAIALAGNKDTPRADEPGPVDTPTNAVEPTPTPPTESAPDTMTVAGYYLGDTPAGPRLYRELTQVEADNPLDAAILALEQVPADPDYRTPWPVGSFSGAGFDGIGDDGVISVVLADASLHDRPAGMSQVEAEAAVQQVVYTMQAAMKGRMGVQFYYDHNPIDTVLGVPTSEPLANASPLDTLSHVSIGDPAEGQEVSGTFHASGVANSFEANVRWELRQGDAVALEGFFTATGWMADRLFPFEGDVDVSSLEPGTYTFVVSEDDPSGGAEGNGPDTDTRTVVVR